VLAKAELYTPAQVAGNEDLEDQVVIEAKSKLIAGGVLSGLLAAVLLARITAVITVGSAIDWFIASAAIAVLAVILYAYFRPYICGYVTFGQFIVAKLHKRAQRATYLAVAADQALVTYKQAERDDKTCPRALWMEACGR